jgi:hypothetical protein
MMTGRPPVPPAADASGGRRPWEVIVAAALGAVAPIFILLALVVAALTGGKVMRTLGKVLHSIGDEGNVAGVSAAGDIAAFTADVILTVGVVVGLAVMIGFAAYAWRVLVGRGRARWVALVCLGLGFFVVTPLSPLLVGGFLLLGTLSVVFAFLPRSSAWFAARRLRRQSRAVP